MRPTIITPSDIATAMGLSEDALWKLARNCERCFKPRRMQAVGRKHRPIDPMHLSAKRLFRRLHRWLQRQRLFHPAAHGGVQDSSCFRSAERHLGRNYVWARDARNCYPSVSPKAMFQELKALGFHHDTAVLLTRLFTVRGQIPQGSPLSCDALNLFFRRIDQVMASFCGHHRLSYSRVADDFEFSGNHKEAGHKATQLVEKLLSDRDISINKKKRAKDGFQDRSSEQQVHSIAVGSRRGTKISSQHRAKAMDVANAYLAACKSLQPSSLEPLAHKRCVLQGWMHYCRQAHFGPAKYLRRQLEAGDRIVKRRFRSLSISVHKGKWWLMTTTRNEPRRLAKIWHRRVAGGEC